MLSNIAKKATKIYGAENRTLAISSVGNSCITTAPPPPVQLTSVNSNGTALSNHHSLFTGPGPIPALGNTGQLNYNNNNNNLNNNNVMMSNHVSGAVGASAVGNNNSASVTATSPTSLSNTHLASSTSSAPVGSQLVTSAVLPASAASGQPRNST